MNHHSHNEWNFMNYNNSNTNTGNEVTLQEPVAFDDFQFSLGLDPDFAIPIPLDMPPPTSMTENDIYPIEPIAAPINHSLLNENDQKAFSQFLDQFFVDPNMQIDPQFSSMYDNHLPPSMSLNTNDDEEYYRQSSILQSLDEQKSHILLQSSNSVTLPYIKPVLNQSISTPTTTMNEDNELSEAKNSHKKQYNGSGGGGGGGGNGGGAIRRGKSNKELLTEEEKRNNHIASEQKRRSMIRTGFKDLTDIVPTLKNINNSKSTVLFKAVDYIKYLEKRNKNLRDKIKNLELRVEVEGRMNILNRPPASSKLPVSSNTTTAALLQHKTQQKQLMELQEKLHMHQKILSQQQTNNDRWHHESKPEMDVDSTDSLIKTTVSA